MCGYRNENSAAPPVFRDQLIFSQFLFYLVNVCTWLIDLIDSNNDLYTSCFCMIDSLYSLWHNTIICCYYQDSNISRLGTSHTHSGKCLMSRCIKEGDFSSVDLNNRSTNMLCDTASLSGSYIGLADCIQKGCFTMVNVTHYTDYRWSGNHICFVFIIFFQKFSNNINLFFLLTENIKFHCDLFCLLIVNLLV